MIGKKEKTILLKVTINPRTLFCTQQRHDNFIDSVKGFNISNDFPGHCTELRNYERQMYVHSDFLLLLQTDVAAN